MSFEDINESLPDKLNYKYSGENDWMVICGTKLEKDEDALLIRFVKKFGGSVVEDYNEKVTHLIAKTTFENDCYIVKRTLKYVYGILNGKWILSFDCM